MRNGPKPPALHRNRLLASLPRRDYERLLASLVPVPLQYKYPLYEANQPMEFERENSTRFAKDCGEIARPQQQQAGLKLQSADYEIERTPLGFPIE